MVAAAVVVLFPLRLFGNLLFSGSSVLILAVSAKTTACHSCTGTRIIDQLIFEIIGNRMY